MALDPLQYIEQYESGGRNVFQSVVPASVSTASGYFQITNSTWASIPADITQGYDTAISAPYEVQAAAAAYLYNQSGFQPWSSNSNLMNAVDSAGGSNAFTAPGTLSTDVADYATTASDAAGSTLTMTEQDLTGAGLANQIGDQSVENVTNQLDGGSGIGTAVASAAGTALGGSSSGGSSTFYESAIADIGNVMMRGGIILLAVALIAVAAAMAMRGELPSMPRMVRA